MIFKDPFQFQTIMILIVTEQYTSYQTCILLFLVGLEENDAICQFVQVLLILDLSLARIMSANAISYKCDEHEGLVEHLGPSKLSLLCIFSVENILLLMLLYSKYH